MEKPQFVYVTYIKTTPEKLWQALTDPEFTRRYWVGTWQESSWKKGASWRMVTPVGGVNASGHIEEIDPPRKLVLFWMHEKETEAKGECSRMTYDIDPQGELVKLTIIHEADRPDSKLLGAVSKGWPLVLSSLKSLLETGESLAGTRSWPEDGGCAAR